MRAQKAQLYRLGSYMFVLQFILGKSLNLLVASYTKEKEMWCEPAFLLLCEVVSMMNF